eukprot:TRINITY_DN4421_c0_g1_i1.p1 TRINITY_DN4421_c0_g1~~TRINITY_DN4421_c0_g1_i1.p1  ORF type:complete len:116 (-),score=18.68 TRINITY_DN4421_c0_g1_i1:17-364(-)
MEQAVRQGTLELHGITTEIVVQSFSDRTMVNVTQLEKMGTMLLVTSEASGMGGRSFNVKTLLGRRDDPLLVVYARQLAEQMRLDHPLLLAIALKEEGRDSATFAAVINKVLGLGR